MTCHRCEKREGALWYWTCDTPGRWLCGWLWVCDLCWLELAERDSLARWLREAV